MIEAIHQKDWSRTPLGPMADWPDSLRTAVSICVNSQFAMAILWGDELVLLYNDAYSEILGDKHPCALGLPVATVWSEIWPTIAPMLRNVLIEGKSNRKDDLMLLMQRHGFLEECYFTFSYSPIMVEGGLTGGVFVTVLETTERVVNERRLRTLGELVTKVAVGRDHENAFGLIADAISRDPHTFPLSALYLFDRENQIAALVFSTGLQQRAPRWMKQLPLTIDERINAENVIARIAQGCEPQPIDLEAVLSEDVQCGAGPDRPRELLALPLILPGQALPRGVFLVAANPRRPFDNEYRAFFDLVLGHIVTAVAHADAVAMEQRRVASLADLDRVKSEFFVHTSHELRTPVTLILGPIQELLDRDNEALSLPVRERLEMVRRNAIRLHRIVNSILDYAGIESGRLRERPEPTNVGKLTSEIASLYRSAVETAKLEFVVHCSSQIPRLLIDRQMWEKVVANLISNAFKFTRKGRIDVFLEHDRDFLCLQVRDTGVGIAGEDLPRIFERFFRGHSAAARSVEGTGIGLSLVQQLVRLQGGEITVESQSGVGSTFTVRLPCRVAPPESLPDKPGDTMSSAGKVQGEHANEVQLHGTAGQDFEKSVIGEAADQHASAYDAGNHTAAGPAAKTKVLVIDDNADFVQYITRLLRDKCEVIAASDGISGLDEARKQRPDLIVMDVMMPGLDGFGLLRAIRSEQTGHTVPVIMLSARAGEEARLKALEAGADDYLVKPFSGRELTARVHSQVQMVRLRRDAVRREGELLSQIAEVQEKLELVVEGTSDAVATLDKNLRIMSVNVAMAQILSMPRQVLIGRALTDFCEQERDPEFERAMHRAIKDQTVESVEHLHSRSGRWFNVRCYPAPHGLTTLGTDITEKKKAEQALLAAHAELEEKVTERTRELREANNLLSAVFERAPGGIAITDTEGRFVHANAAYQQLIGYSACELLFQSMQTLTHPEDYPKKKALLEQLLSGEREFFEMEMRYCLSNGSTIWVNSFVSTIGDESHGPRYFVKITQDIGDRKRADREILASQKELRALYDRLQTVREEERVALAREVHDQLGQILSAAKIDIKLLEDDVGAKSGPLSRRKILAELRSARNALDEAIQSARRIATELRPPELEDHGLFAAIEWHARDFQRRTRITCSVAVCANLCEPTGATATALFRVFQESMTNVLRHANATHIWISIKRRGGRLLLRIRDNGTGISPVSVRSSRSIGLTGMRERVALIRGRLVVCPLRTNGTGTLVAVSVPLLQNNDALARENDQGRNLQAGDAA